MSTAPDRISAANYSTPDAGSDFSRLMSGPVESIRPGFDSMNGFELLQRMATLFSKSTMVPQQYQGRESIGNCAIALNIAARLGADPLMVMQNLVIVHGKPTWSAQFLIATVNCARDNAGRQRFTALRYEFFGERGTDTWGCRAWAIEHATGERLVGSDITIAIAKKERWYDRNGSKWQSIPQQMLMYRAGTWWTRAYAPELSMGLHTSDEAEDSAISVPTGANSMIEALRRVEQDMQAAVEPPVIETVDTETGEVTQTVVTAAPAPVADVPVASIASNASSIPPAVDAMLTLFSETETVAALDGLGRDANKLIKQYPECADAIKTAGSKRRAALLAAEKNKSAPDDAGIGSDFGDFE